MTAVGTFEARRDQECPRRIRRTLEGVLGVPATEGNRVDVLRNGDEIFPAMLDAIAGAEHTLDFLTFVYWAGDVGRVFARALTERARAGVRVRVLLDGYGCRPMERDLIGQMAGSGVQVRWFRPLRRFHPGQINHPRLTLSQPRHDRQASRVSERPKQRHRRGRIPATIHRHMAMLATCPHDKRGTAPPAPGAQRSAGRPPEAATSSRRARGRPDPPPHETGVHAVCPTPGPGRVPSAPRA